MNKRCWVRIQQFGVGALVTLLILLTGSGCNKEESKPSGPASNPGSSSRIHKASDGSSLKLAFVTNNTAEFWKIAAAGIRKYEKEANVQVDIKMPPNGKTEEQNATLENLVSQGYHGVAFSPIAPLDQIQVINRTARRTNVITFDSDSATSDRVLYIGTDNFEAGRTLGREIVRLLPDGGKIAVFVGTLATDNAAQRLAGIEDAIKGHKIEIAARKEDATDRAKARTNAEDVLNAFPDINLLCGLWSYNGPAIASAIEASGKKGKVLAAVFDEEQGTLDGIKAGVIQCTVVQKPFMFGYLSSKWLHELAIKGDAAKIPESRVIDTGVEVIGPANVVEFEKNLVEMKKGS